MSEHSEQYVNDLYGWMESLERNQHVWTREEADDNHNAVARLGTAWILTREEDGQEFVIGYYGTEKEAQIEACYLEESGYDPGRLAVYPPGDLYSV